MDRQFLVEREKTKTNMFLLSVNVKHEHADNDACAGHVLTSTRARI